MQGGTDLQAAFSRVSLMRGRRVPETPQQGAWLQSNQWVVTNAVAGATQGTST
jgi:hypothetical protein